MKKFWGKDFGIVALAKNYPAEKFMIKISRDLPNGEIIQESDFWIPAIKNIVEEKTKFGRIGILYNRKNKEAGSFCQKLVNEKFDYKQKNTRSEKSAKFSFIEMQVLSEMASEGLSDSVEFRRLLRKSIRNAKHLHLDSILFLEAIFAEKRTRQIITKMAGTQIKVYFVTDFLNLKSELNMTANSPLRKGVGGISENPAKKIFKIETDDNLEFTKSRAEQILERNLKESNIIKFS